FSQGLCDKSSAAMQPAHGQRIALVTGASSGIGEAITDVFSKHGFAVIACGRRMDKLLDLVKRCEGAPVYPLAFDATEKESVLQKIASLPVEWRRISVLINNAGNAHGLDSIEDGNPDDWDSMIDINIRGLLYVTKAVLPMMPVDSDSIIVNLGSIAGKEAYGKGNVYCATKAAVDQLTRGMRIDLYTKGIRVAALHPGMVNTNFSVVRFKGDKQKADKVYVGTRALTAGDCADTALFMCTRPAHVNVADVLLLPTDQASAGHLRRSKL
ncbi:NADP-dependent 3-hydroxy acid dehydrogenase YdfG, partial [Diplonema papillatum]